MSSSPSDKEVSDLVRADILQLLSQRGDRVVTLSSKHLSFPEYADFFWGSAQYLEREGLISLGKRQRYVERGGCYSSAQITAKGEALLDRSPKGTAASLKNLLVEAFKDASKEKVTEVIKDAPMLLWTTYSAWQAGTST